MYNEERKEKFIKSYTGSEKSAHYIKVVFNKFESFEETEWHEDLCMQSAERLSPIINSQTGTRMGSAERALVVIREYVKWCARNGIETSDGVLNVRVDVIEAVKEQMIGSPAHLERKLKKIFKQEDEKSIDCLYRAYIWLMYSGLTDKEAMNVKVDEVDLSELIIRHNNKIYEMYKESKKTFEQACTLTEFKYIHSQYKHDVYNPRVPGTNIMRGTKTGNIKPSTIKSVITKKTKECGIKLSYKKIYYSGIFYRIYELERIGEIINFRDYVKELLLGNDYTINRNRTLNKIINEKTRALEIDYEKWKCAFSV